jgi:hypothetical protein
LFDDNVGAAAAAVDGEATPPTLSAPSAATPNVPVVAPDNKKAPDPEEHLSRPCSRSHSFLSLYCCSSLLQSSITVNRLDCSLESEPYLYGPLLLRTFCNLLCISLVFWLFVAAWFNFVINIIMIDLDEAGKGLL